MSYISEEAGRDVWISFNLKITDWRTRSREGGYPMEKERLAVLQAEIKAQIQGEMRAQDKD